MRSLFAFVLFIYIVDCKKFRSDYNFHSEAKGWLKLQMPTTFHNAWIRCRMEGAVLASPSNAVMESAIRTEMSNQLISGGIFTGIHATFSKGYFISIEGIPLNNMQLEWMPNEPDNKNNDEECILYNTNKTIADIRCSEIHPYICYKEDTPDVIVNECGTVDKEYKLDTRTGKCYKFHQVARNWTQAFKICSTEGGHLAIINSDTENQVLREGCGNHDITFIGFHDWNEAGVWTTIHGTSLREAGFEAWSSGEPNHGAPEEQCGSIYNNGQLNDMYCTSLTRFICEKSPESFQDDDDNLNKNTN